jgi:hypothetical protein
MISMNASATESIKKTVKSVFFILCTLLFTLSMAGCVYRLTNLHTASPNNIRTIHIEAVYDTSAEPVPHELLWDSLQRAIAANGQLKIASAEKADAILRAHIINTQVSKGGERKILNTNRRRKESNVFLGQSGPPTPGTLRDLSVTDDFFVKTSWSSSVRVELWDLNTKALLLQREYPLTGDVVAYRGDLPTQIHHLRYEEQFQHSFGNATRGLAERIVSDLLVR